MGNHDRQPGTTDDAHGTDHGAADGTPGRRTRTMGLGARTPVVQRKVSDYLQTLKHEQQVAAHQLYQAILLTVDTTASRFARLTHRDEVILTALVRAGVGSGGEPAALTSAEVIRAAQRIMGMKSAAWHGYRDRLRSANGVAQAALFAEISGLNEKKDAADGEPDAEDGDKKDAADGGKKDAADGKKPAAEGGGRPQYDPALLAVARDLVGAAVHEVESGQIVSRARIRSIQKVLLALGVIGRLSDAFDYKEILNLLVTARPGDAVRGPAWDRAHVDTTEQTFIADDQLAAVRPDAARDPERFDHDGATHQFTGPQVRHQRLPIFRVDPGAADLSTYFDAVPAMQHTEHHDLDEPRPFEFSGQTLGAIAMDQRVTVATAPASLIFTVNDLFGNDLGGAARELLAANIQPVVIPPTLVIGGTTYHLARVHYWRGAHYRSHVETATGWKHTNDVDTGVRGGGVVAEAAPQVAQGGNPDVVTSVSYRRADQPAPAQLGQVRHHQNSCYLANLLYLIAGDPTLSPVFSSAGGAPDEDQLDALLAARLRDDRPADHGRPTPSPAERGPTTRPTASSSGGADDGRGGLAAGDGRAPVRRAATTPIDGVPEDDRTALAFFASRLDAIEAQGDEWFDGRDGSLAAARFRTQWAHWYFERMHGDGVDAQLRRRADAIYDRVMAVPMLRCTDAETSEPMATPAFSTPRVRPARLLEAEPSGADAALAMPKRFDRKPLPTRVGEVGADLGELVDVLHQIIHADDLDALDLAGVIADAGEARAFYGRLIVGLEAEVDAGGDRDTRARMSAVNDHYARMCGLFLTLRDLHEVAVARSRPRPQQASNGGADGATSDDGTTSSDTASGNESSDSDSDGGSPGDRARQQAARVLLERWRIARRLTSTIDHDHLHKTTVTDRRGQALAATHGDGHLAGVYGLRSVRNQGKEQRELVFGHDSTPAYMRDSVRDIEDSFAALLQAHGRDPKQLFRTLFIVNSPMVVEKLKFFLADRRKTVIASKLLGSNLAVEKLGEHLYVLQVKAWGKHDVPKLWGATSPEDTERPEDVLNGLLKTLGAYPSQFEIMKALGKPQDSAKRLDLDNAATLGGLLAAPAFQRLDELARGGRHSMAAVVGSAVHMIAGLVDHQDAAAFKHDALVDDALRAIGNLVRALAASLDNTERGTRLYDLIVEELHLILATVRPADRAGYQRAIHAVQDERVPTLAAHPLWHRQSHLAASGMDAITTALAAASKSHSTGIEMPERDKGTDYFEIKPTIDYRGKIEDRGKVVVYGLNPSTPVQRPDHGALIALVKAKLADRKHYGHLSLVIDNTIETDGGDEGQLESIFQALAQPIEQGRLQILLAKSFQKYGSHGTGKVMAGNLTQISHGKHFDDTSDFIDKADKRADNYTLDEAQLMTHMVAHGHRDELSLIQHAAGNAEMLDQMWPGADDPKAGHQPGLPFVIRGLDPLQFGGGRPLDAIDAVKDLGLEFRDSFSFQNTSALGVIGPEGPKDERIRINTGQESPGEMTEKFYALGRLAADKKRERVARGGSGPLQIALADVMALIDSEIEQFRGLGLDVEASGGDYAQLFRLVEVGVGRFRGDERFGNKIASCLHLAATLIKPKDGEAAQLGEVLAGFLASEPSGVSPTMRKQLGRHLLELVLGGSAAAIAAHLPAIQRAARLVPSYLGLALFRDTLTEATCVQLDDNARRVLTEELLAGLDRATLLALLNSLHKQPAKATSLRHHLRAELASPALDDGGGLLAPDITAPMTVVPGGAALAGDADKHTIG